jgi:hypothetical protein
MTGAAAGTLEALIDEGRALLAEERRLCLAGALTDLGALAPLKAGYVARLEAAAERHRATEETMAALAALVAEARENEGLLQAVRAGVRAARRRISELVELRSGAVAYWRDGSRIVSRDDAAGKSTRA